ncbi:MAG: HpnA protein, partial [Planctomycetes bacterium]|nr:HpnA protein [Planctomycetota bacterium]
DAVIVNPSYLLGPWDWKPSSGRMLLEVARGRGVLAPSGGNNFCHVGDVAAGMLAALDRGKTGERYILGGQEASYLDAWRVFADVTGARPPIGVARPWMLRAAGRAGDLWTRISRHEPNLNSAAVSISLLSRHLAGTRAASELDYSPRPYRQGAEEAWEWFCQFGYAPRRVRRRAAARRLAAR